VLVFGFFEIFQFFFQIFFTIYLFIWI